MNTNKFRSMRSMTRNALAVSGMVIAAGICSAAHAQEMGYAQKFLSATNETRSMQFRSTIIDPTRGKKLMATNSATLRVIPINNPAELNGQNRACNICGVVESISITLRERAGTDARDDDAMADIAIHHEKGRNGWNSTRSGLQTPPDAGKPAQNQAAMYEVKVRMSDGTVRIVNEVRQPDYTVGDYVRVISGAVTAV